MIYDRPYMRGGSTGQRHIAWLNWILGVTIGCFVFQMMASVWGGYGRLINDWFALSTGHLLGGKVWTLLSYALLHGGIGHLIFNLLVIFFIGRMLEPLISQERILQVYLLAVVVGGIIYCLVHFQSRGSLVGASAGALGLLILYCTLQPERPITLLLFFVLPVTIKPKWLAWVALAMDGLGLLFIELPMVFNRAPVETSNVGYSAHLGGMLAGWLYCKFYLQGGFARSPRRKVSIEPPDWLKRKPNKPGAKARGYKVNVTDRKEIKREVDRILDKINTQGFGSLSSEEKTTLEKAKDLL